MDCKQYLSELILENAPEPKRCDNKKYLEGGKFDNEKYLMRKYNRKLKAGNMFYKAKLVA